MLRETDFIESFILLNELNIDANMYLKIAKQNAKRYGVNEESLNFSNTKNKKLCIRDDNNKLINFGSSINGDYIIWSILEKRKEVDES